MKKKLILFIIMMLMAIVQSCSAGWHLRKAISKDPNILMQRDTVVETEVVVQEKTVTEKLIVNQIDTVILTSPDGVQVRLERIYDTVMVDVICPPETLMVETIVELPPVVEYKESDSKNKYQEWGMIALGIIIGLMLVRKVIDKLFS
jgi:hypothetical protein